MMLVNITLSLLVVLVISGLNDAANYCDVCNDHTLCKYQGIGSSCGDKSNVFMLGVNDGDKKVIVDAHNTYRSRVAQGQQQAQPSAANMRKMQWNQELADIAQMWAQQCVWDHDSCRDTAEYYVGQNAYLTSSTRCPVAANWTRAVKSWYDEVAKFDKKNIAPFSTTSGTGHYTQLVWAASNQVGCGLVGYTDGKWYKLQYMCNYGPGGNVQGMGNTVYDEGPPCSKCPAGSKCDAGFRGLCV